MTAVRPTRTAAAYIGGKRQLASTLTAKIETIPHTIYAEPFVGMGGVFFRRAMKPRTEAINDLSKDVATFFRVLQRHYQALMDMLKWQVTSRSEYQRLADQDPDTLTDLERAARFLYLQRLTFGGKVASRVFGIDTGSPARFDITKLGSILEEAHERLAGVWIECLPYAEFIRRWDRPGTLFYLDPPYFGTEHYYGRDLFKRDDFQALADVLKAIQGRFILTVNDVPEIREIFSFAEIETANLTYTAGGAGKPSP
jgi:Site-specific DNA methylase